MVEELFGEKISDGVIENILNRAGESLEDEYEEIGALLQEAEVVGGDETGWRIGGGNGWLWHFQNGEAAYYKVDESRSGEVAKGVLGEEFDGILLTDFWGGYNRVKAKKKQKCLSHLLRDIKYGKEVEKQGESEGEWCERLEEVIKEATEIVKSRQGMGEEEYWQAVERVEAELDRLLIENVRSEEGRKLRKRLLKHRGEIFTFLYVEGVPFNNNGSERGIRKAVIHRKISGGSRSDEGAKRFGVIMSVIETMRKRREEILTGLVARLGGKDLEIIHCHSP
jgi:transposase